MPIAAVNRDSSLVASGASEQAHSPIPLRPVGKADPITLAMSNASSSPRAHRAPWWAPVASGLVPGTGQLALDQQRSVAYLVAEAYLLVQAFSAQREVTQGIRDYQTIAATTARRPYTATFPIGPWGYYETMEKFDASGRFDRLPGGDVDPEDDETTYNGQSWLLARNTFWTNPNIEPSRDSPEYQRALAFYAGRAWRDEFRWSWRDAQNVKDVYQRKIATTNRSNQRKTNLLTVVGANHLASLIDAYINVRIRRYGGVGVAGLRLDAINSHVGLLGDPARGSRTIGTSIRLVPNSRP